jgi:TP901 family phage tail tape measure protein
MSNNLNVAVNFSAIDKLTKPYRQLSKTNANFSKGVIKTATQLDKLKKAQAKVASYKGLEKRLSEGANKADKYRAELRDMQSQIKATNAPTKKLTNAYSRKQRQLTTLIGKNKTYKKDLGRSRAEMRRMGLSTRRTGDEQARLTKKIDATSRALKKQVTRQDRLNRVSKRGKQAAATGAATAVIVSVAGRAFTGNEDAEIDLKTALLDKNGKLPPQLTQIAKQAKALGNKLPGTTADFFNVARTLSEQGVQAELIANGGLKSASELAVVLNLVPEEAAKMVAKARESFGLASDELEKMADLTQRTKFAFGLTPDDLGEANKFAATSLNALKITGIDNARLVLAIEGLAAQKGLEGSSFGTSFSRFLDGATAFSSNITTKARAPQLKALNDKGLNFDFFGSDGKFKGLENAIKLTESWKNSLNDQQFANLIDKMFGDQGKRVAEILASEGIGGFEKALARLEGQASINQRIALQTSKLSSKGEAVTGSLSNIGATLFEPIAGPLKKALDWVNELIGATDEWLSNDNKLGQYSASLLAVAVAAKVSSIGTSAALGAAGVIAPSLTLSIINKLKNSKIFGWLGKLRGAFAFVARHIGTVLRLLPLLLTPWGLIGLAVAGLALVVYKNWDLIKKTVADGQSYISLKIAEGIEHMAGLKNQWLQAGAEMVNGLIDGIKSRASALSDTVKEFLYRPVRDVKDLLGLESKPQVSEAFLAKVNSTSNLVKKPAFKTSGNLLNALPKLAVAASLAAAPQLAAAATPQNNSPQIVSSPVITINVDPKNADMANDIGKAVRRELEAVQRSQKQNYNSRLFD